MDEFQDKEYGLGLSEIKQISGHYIFYMKFKLSQKLPITSKISHGKAKSLMLTFQVKTFILYLIDIIFIFVNFDKPNLILLLWNPPIPVKSVKSKNDYSCICFANYKNNIARMQFWIYEFVYLL
jgi:hypothetical protein